MALMMGALYDALRSANVDDDKSRRAAAEEVADFQKQIGDLKADMSVVKWMLGFVLATNVALVLLALRTVA
jgi:hypothetical protein